MGSEIGPEQLSPEDREHLNTVVRKGIEEMESHVEVFTFPSGRKLTVWCDGIYGWGDYPGAKREGLVCAGEHQVRRKKR